MPGRRPFELKLDHGGMAELLKSSEVRAEIDGLAAKVRAAAAADPNVIRHAAPIQQSSYTTDRAAASVTIRHVVGRGLQSKYGVLTKAAGAAGLKVRAR